VFLFLLLFLISKRYAIPFRNGMGNRSRTVPERFRNGSKVLILLHKRKASDARMAFARSVIQPSLADLREDQKQTVSEQSNNRSETVPERYG